jgi:multidrug efflux pump subunit AcrA (membrane-fusion protein)
MISSAPAPLPQRRRELTIRPLGEQGQHVVKDPATGEFFHLGAQEHFLLMQLDGRASADCICAAFAERFGEPLAADELEEFIELARSQSLLQAELPQSDVQVDPARLDSSRFSSPTSARVSSSAAHGKSQNILYWRRTLFDPDRLFDWLEPRIRFFWTPAFMILSGTSIVLAAWVSWANSSGMAESFRAALRWETPIIVWLILLVITTLHECAHGLTCKHYGGQVREIGFLLMLFMPCFYCNVSDAWLFREKSKRLRVTLAGGYFELFLWSLAVFVWRVSIQDTLVHYLAFVVLSVCGLQSLVNFNPFVKLDGYYLLSDWVEVPNLRQRAVGYVSARLRWLLWGAKRPPREPRGGLLLGYGAASVLFSLAFLGLMLWSLGQWLGSQWGFLGVAPVLLLGLVAGRGLLHGVFAGEAKAMIIERRKRTILWLIGLSGLAAVLCFVEIDDRACGTARLRPTVRSEVRSPLAAFLKEVYFDEGGRVSPGAPVARLEIPDLDSRKAQKDAEVREAQARLSLLEEGTRPQELAEQRKRVARARAWRDLAQKDLTHARSAMDEELSRLDRQIAQYRFEYDAARDAYQRAEALRGKSVVSEEQYREAKRRVQVAQSQLEQVQFQKRHRQALGTREAIAGLDAEAELARREKDLADAQGTLTLMEAGTRPAEIEAARAHLSRLQEETRYLEKLESQLCVHSPVPGLMTTARLKDKIGQYVREGELICLVEEPNKLEAEIVLAEQDVARVHTGQVVTLKARALPFETFQAKVDRVAPTATRADVQGTVTVYCQFDNPGLELRPEMSGYARVLTGRRPIGAVAVNRALRYLRTEFWW